MGEEECVLFLPLLQRRIQPFELTMTSRDESVMTPLCGLRFEMAGGRENIVCVYVCWKYLLFMNGFELCLSLVQAAEDGIT